MKNTYYILSTLFIVFLMTSCTKSDFPQINNLELGLDNSKKVYLGEDFHIEAEIVAAFLIQRIEIKIHDEKLDAGETAPGWEFSKVTIFSENLKNTTVHEDIPVPLNVATGEYHIDITVTDKDGNQSKKEAHIDLLRK